MAEFLMLASTYQEPDDYLLPPPPKCKACDAELPSEPTEVGSRVVDIHQEIYYDGDGNIVDCTMYADTVVALWYYCANCGCWWEAEDLGI